MVRCKSCKVVLDIHPLREKKYRCLGCKTVLLGSSYYRYPDTKAEPYVGVGAGRSARHEFDQEDIALSADAESISGMELPLEDLLDFDLSSPAPAKSSPVGSSEDIDLFDDLSAMDFGSHGKMAQAKAQAQAQTQVQADRGQVAPLDQEVLKAFTPYKIVREIARGGMGIIYEAQHPKFGKVALKLLPESEEIEDVDVQRFVREGEALRKLSHPNIIPFYESGLKANRHFLAMKFQEGRTLDKIRLKQGAFQPKKAAALLIPLLSALDHAHSQEVLHRDIKPENIIVDDTGVPYLMDFGIAKLMGENETKKLTAKGTTVGTPSYMPPEQAQGKKLTPSCDVYSMGAVLYEMLANQCPYTGSNAVEIMKNVVHQPLKSLASYGNFPQEIIWICETALEKNPQARFQLAKEMEMTLQAFVDGKSLIAIKTIVPDRSSYSQNRNRLSGPQRSASRMTAAGRSGTRSSLSRKTGDSEPKKSPILPILFSLLVIGILAGTLFYLSQSNSPPEGTEVSSSTIAKPPNPIAENPSQDPPKDPSKGVRTASTPSDTLSEEEERMIQGFFSLGKVAEQDRDYAKARDYYDNILSDLKKILSQPKKHPYFPLAYVRYCVAHYELGFVSETEAALDRHLIEYPKDWEAQLLKIKCLRNKRNSLSIIRQIGEMESYFPERTKEILLMKGEAYEELANKPDGNPQDIDQAIQTYNILLSKDDENVEVLTRLGNLYLKNNQTPGDFAKVVEYYTRAGEISKKQGELSPTIQGNLGLAYLFSQRIDEGVALLQNVLKGEQKLDEETRIRFLKYLLQFLENLKDYQVVIYYAQQLIEFNKKDYNTMTLIAGAYLKIEEPDLEAAKKWYTEARNTYISDYTHKQNRARGSNIPMQIDLPICLEKRAQFITEVLKPPQYLTAIKDLERAAEIYKDLQRFPDYQRLNTLIESYKSARKNNGEDDSKKEESDTPEKEPKKEPRKDPKKEEERDPLDDLDDLFTDDEDKEKK